MRLPLTAGLWMLPALALAAEVPVQDAAALRSAIAEAEAGDHIVLAAGDYRVDRKLNCDADGTAEAPIRVSGPEGGGARVIFYDDSGVVEGFHVKGAHWVFEDLRIEGDCDDHSRCEHAWHIVGDADGTILRRNVASRFNAHIKSNGSGDPFVYPDDVLIEDNEFFSPEARQTGNPVTPIDVVGGRRWVVRANYIHDFHKAGGNGVSYAAFLKGNGVDGRFERNLVVCEALHTGGTRIGLSFGGGGTGPDSICEEGTCNPEHRRGVMVNNIVARCPRDVCVYVNECEDCEIEHNTFYDCAGLDVRFEGSRTTVRYNVSSGRIRARDGATLVAEHNHTSNTATLRNQLADPDNLDFNPSSNAPFIDPSDARSLAVDFCLASRDATPDWGAVEHGTSPCDTSRPASGGSSGPGPDAGQPDAGDAGTEDSGPDAGPPDTGLADQGLVDAGPVPDAGAADAGAPDQGTDAGVTAPPSDEDDEGCTCAQPRRASAPLALIGILGGFGLMLRRRRR